MKLDDEIFDIVEGEEQPFKNMVIDLEEKNKDLIDQEKMLKTKKMREEQEKDADRPLREAEFDE